ncbi:MAG: adenylate/guanylate cyclase domain-containing protein [Deltaproteobacteria bacterium]|nr:adenylate/guanylate cyclase domain-containing protein [Deltaproteobacteria bacterium]
MAGKKPEKKTSKKGGGFIFSLKYKILIGILFFVATLMGTVIGLINKNVRETILAESIEKGLAVARGIATASEDPLLTNDDLTLFSTLKGIQDNTGVVYGMVVDMEGTIRGHNDVKLSGKPYIGTAGSSVFKIGKDYIINSYMGETGTTYDISIPIFSIGATDEIGRVHLGLSEKTAREAVEKASRYIIYLSAIGLLLGGIGAFLMATVMVKPIKLLVSGVRAIGEGKFHQRINIKRRDEIGELTSAFNDMAKGLEEREFIRNTFQKFVHKDIVNELLKNPDKVKVGGERKKVTVLFSDIRGFTPLSENMPPEEVVALLNRHFSSMLPIINKNGGVLDKFMGDAMMVTFGAPFPKGDDALMAVKTGLMMKDMRRALNKNREKEGKAPIHMGIGINTGYVVAGNIGSEERMEYTVFGDVVNTAARIEGLSREEDVIITEDTYKEIMNSVTIGQEKEEVSLKGKSRPVTIYRVLSIKES